MANFGNKGGQTKTRGRGGGSKLPPLPMPFEIVVSRCKVCSCPQRKDVDSLLVSGWTNEGIREWLNNIHGTPEKPEAFTRNNISTHKNKHLSLNDATTRKIIEKKALQAGLDIETMADFILTRSAVAETIVHTGMQQMLRGGTVPETKDVLAAMAYLDKLDEAGRDVAVDEMLAEFQQFAASVKWVLVDRLGEDAADDWYRAIYDEFENKLDARKPKALTTGTKVSAEVIEDGVYEEAK